MTPQRAFVAHIRQARAETLSLALSWGVWPSRAQLQQESCALHQRLHPVPLTAVETTWKQNLYNWGQDALWVARDGTGVLCAEHCFGAHSGDGINTHIHLLLPGDVHATFSVGMDYLQPTLTLTVSGPAHAALLPVQAAVLAMLERLHAG